MKRIRPDRYRITDHETVGYYAGGPLCLYADVVTLLVILEDELIETKRKLSKMKKKSRGKNGDSRGTT